MLPAGGLFRGNDRPRLSAATDRKLYYNDRASRGRAQSPRRGGRVTGPPNIPAPDNTTQAGHKLEHTNNHNIELVHNPATVINSGAGWSAICAPQ